MSRSPPSFGATYGMSLNAGSGTLVRRQEDESYVHVAKTDGDDNYKRMMQRRNEAYPDPVDPGGDLADLIRDYPRQALRNFRKYLGLPASADVGRIATIMKSLLDSAQQQLPDEYIEGIVVSTPGVIGFTSEDVDDALDYLNSPGLRLTPSYDNAWPSALQAAFVANGFGLCDSSSDSEARRREINTRPWHSVFFLDYSDAALTLEYSAAIRYPIGGGTERRVRFWQSYEGSDGSRLEITSEAVVSFLRHVSYGRKLKVDLVFIAGDLAASKEQAVGKVLRTALNAVGVNDGWRVFDAEPMWMTARGAAELAWHEASRRRQKDHAPEELVMDRLEDLK